MKLYYAKGACSLAVRIAINELNLNCQYESVDLKDKITEDNQNYLDINLKGAVPALELDNGDVLTENVVIQQYLADTHNGHALLPPIGDLKRYHVLASLEYVSTELHKTLGALFNPNITNDMKSDFIMPMVMNKFKYVNSILEQQDYFSGPAFTLSDGYLFVILRWAKFFEIDLSNFSNILRYFDNLNERESIRKSLEQEGIGSVIFL